jgi:hypothetical protein
LEDEMVEIIALIDQEGSEVSEHQRLPGGDKKQRDEVEGIKAREAEQEELSQRRFVFG